MCGHVWAFAICVACRIAAVSHATHLERTRLGDVRGACLPELDGGGVVEADGNALDLEQHVAHLAVTWQSRGNHVAVTWASRGRHVGVPVTWASHGRATCGRHMRAACGRRMGD
eukprot:3851746-Prymnesium_polylepis.1